MYIECIPILHIGANFYNFAPKIYFVFFFLILCAPDSRAKDRGVKPKI